MGARQSTADKITWTEFIDSIYELNDLCRTRFGNEVKYMKFAPAQLSFEEYPAINWWDHIRIIGCVINGGEVVTQKLLTLKEFQTMYHTFKSLNEEQDEDVIPKSMTSSRIILNRTADIEDKCVICMDRENDVLLKCHHSFCLVCVLRQSERLGKNFKCPICRRAIEDPVESSWDVVDIPDSDEVSSYLLSFANNS